MRKKQEAQDRKKKELEALKKKQNELMQETERLQREQKRRAEREAWKVAVGLARLRKGSQVRALGMNGMKEAEVSGLLASLGWL